MEPMNGVYLQTLSRNNLHRLFLATMPIMLSHWQDSAYIRV